MLLSIDPKKIEKQLETAYTSYVVSQSNLHMPDAVESPKASMGHTNSTISVMSPELERSRLRVLSLRQHLMAKGDKSFPTSDLERSIDEARGRV